MTDVASDKKPVAAAPITGVPTPRWKTGRFWRHLGLGLLIAWVVLSLLLWLGGPPLLKKVVPWVIDRKLHLQAEIRDIHINPLRGELRVDGLRIHDGAEPLVGAERIQANLSLASLWRGSISLDDVQLIQPDVNAKIDADGNLNLMKLVPPKDPDDDSKSNVRWAIDHFLLDRGTVHFRDEKLKPVLDVSLDASHIEVKDLRSYESKTPGELAFSTLLDDTTKLAWHGTVDLDKLHSQGEITLQDLPLTRIQELLPMTLPVQASSGRIGFRLPYDVTVTDGKPKATVKEASVTLDDLVTRIANDTQAPLTLPHFAINGIDVAYPAQTVHITKVEATQGAITLQRDRRGNLTLVTALNAPSHAKQAHKPAPVEASAQVNTPDGKAAGKPADKAAASQPWRISLDQLALTGWGITVHDATTNPAVTLPLQPINLTLSQITWPATAPVPLTLDAGLQQGKLQVTGNLDLQQPAADLNIDSSDLPLTLLQPYLAQQLAIRLTRGTANSHLQVHWDNGARGLTVQGDAGLRGFNVIATADHSRLLGADALTAKGLNVSLNKQQTHVQEIVADNLFGQVIISPQRQLNLTQLALPAPGSAPATTPAASGTAAATPAAPTEAPTPAPVAPAPTPVAKQQSSAPGMAVRIDKITVRRSAMLFADQSMTPGFATGIEQLAGQITGLSSRDNATAHVDLKGVVAPAGQVSIFGQMNPLAKALSLDMTLQFRQLELSALTPYAARFAGYRIDRGKLDLDLHYNIQDRALQAENKVVLRQLRLGDKVDSPESVGLPLKLAVAILRDVNDNIDIDLPISGSLDDPKFSVGPIIWKAFVNLLERAVTAPFSVLSNLIGGGADLSNVPFAVGSSDITPAAHDSLGKLAQALTSRPALQLEVRGMSDAQADRKALQIQKVEASLARREQGRKDTRIEGLERMLRDIDSRSAVSNLRELSQVPDPNGKMVLNEAGYEARLLDALASHQTVSDVDLTTLANQRGQAIASTLMTGFSVPAARVFLLDSGQATAKDGLLNVPLKLTTP